MDRAEDHNICVVAAYSTSGASPQRPELEPHLSQVPSQVPGPKLSNPGNPAPGLPLSEPAFAKDATGDWRPDDSRTSATVICLSVMYGIARFVASFVQAAPRKPLLTPDTTNPRIGKASTKPWRARAFLFARTFSSALGVRNSCYPQIAKVARCSELATTHCRSFTRQNVAAYHGIDAVPGKSNVNLLAAHSLPF
jgi:hypothetical protein